MTNVTQENLAGKPQSFRVPTPFGPLTMTVDVDGSRWLQLAPFAGLLGISLASEVMPHVENRYWGRRVIDGRACIPATHANELMGKLRVRPQEAPAIRWFGNNACSALFSFVIPEPATPLPLEEPAAPEPARVAGPQTFGEIVTLTNGVPLTTTLAIAQGTDTQHKNVLELVRTYQVDLEEFGGIAFQTRPFATAGGTQHREVALLNEDQATLLITYMRNSDIVRAFKKRLVKAFRALVEQVKEPAWNVAGLRISVPKTLPEALRTLADVSEKAQEQAATIAVLEPKAAGLDRIATLATEHARTLTDAAKILQQPPRKFITFLQVEGWIYRQNGRWMAYQPKITSGCMEHKFCTVEHSSGPEFDVAQPLITPKGIAKLAAMLGVQAAA